MKYPESTIIPRRVSEQASTYAFLNCLIKEFALPDGGMHYCRPQQTQGITPLGKGEVVNPFRRLARDQ